MWLCIPPKGFGIKGLMAKLRLANEINDIKGHSKWKNDKKAEQKLVSLQMVEMCQI